MYMWQKNLYTYSPNIILLIPFYGLIISINITRNIEWDSQVARELPDPSARAAESSIRYWAYSIKQQHLGRIIIININPIIKINPNPTLN